MTTIQISLPDSLAREAGQAGLLNPEALERILRDELASRRINQLKAARVSIEQSPDQPLTMEEIEAEITAHRIGQRRASDS